jgi:prophage DNA circulation protein
VSLDDLQQGSYKSPSGQVVTFDYEDIESSVGKKTAVFESAVGNGTYVQSNGSTSGRFPMRCYFSGFSYEALAETFLSAILEDGEGVLTHPVFGDITVVPVGQVTRIDPLKSGAGQVIYDVEFYETVGLQIGETGGNAQVFDSLMEVSAMDFSNNVQLADPVDKASFRNKLKSALKKMSDAIKKASGAVAKVNEAIEDTGDSINRGMDTLLGEPLALARQTQLLIGEPRRQASLTNSKALAYQNLAQDIFTGTLAEPSKYAKEAINLFHLNKMMAQSYLGNTAMLLDESTEYLTKADYINAAERLLALREDYQAWHDDNFDSLELTTISEANTDTGDGLAELNQLLSSVASGLIARSFEAKTEMREPIASDRTPLDLCYELYGTTAFDVLDHFVNLNDLVGDEFFLIPKGREIVWHV